MYIRNYDTFFKLDIEGYEFYDGNLAEDLNWLIVIIECNHNNNSWKAKGPYLRTFEISKLIEWFNKIKKGSEPERINFMENEISFEYKSKNKLSVNLDFEFHPKKDKYDYSLDKEYVITFNINDTDIDHILKSLKTFDKLYPIRLNIAKS